MTRLLLFLLLGTSLAGQTIFDNLETIYPHPVANAVTKMRHYNGQFLGLWNEGGYDQ
ncbi:MAG: hypothetical protein P8L44_07075 [Opitutales bacterium]|nr:hypothetical protein [Opitutales bacterium]